MLEFDKKVAVVTGAANIDGIGFAAARRLSREGCNVIMIDIVPKVEDRVKDLAKEGINASCCICDLIKRDTVKTVIDDIVKSFSRIDILVNAAGWHIEGIEDVEEEFSSIDDQNWWTMFDRNLRTNYNITKEVLPHMRKAKYGRIVNVASVLGPILGASEDSAYCASKGGIVGMTRAIAVEVAAENITINCILPGYIAVGTQDECAYKRGLECPTKRNGSPEEVGDVIVFFASKEASYVTGQTIVVDGGSSVEMKF